MTNSTPRPLGPFRTVEQLAEAAAPLREAMSAINASDHQAAEIRTRRHAARITFITDGLGAAGVELGELDARCVSWLAAVADHEEVVAVLDWVLRARVAGQDALREEISDLDTRTASLEAAAYVHALPGIDFPGRLADRVPGPRCGAQEGRSALFAADVTCPACVALLEAEGTR